MIDTCNSLSPIFLNLWTWWTFLSCWWKWCTFALIQKKVKLPFRKTKQEIQSLSYVGPNTWNSLSDHLKSITSVSSFKHYVKEYLLKKSGNVEADIYSYPQVDTKTKFLEFMQNRISIVFSFFFVSISRFFPMLSIFPLRDF